MVTKLLTPQTFLSLSKVEEEKEVPNTTIDFCNKLLSDHAKTNPKKEIRIYIDGLRVNNSQLTNLIKRYQHVGWNVMLVDDLKYNYKYSYLRFRVPNV